MSRRRARALRTWLLVVAAAAVALTGCTEDEVPEEEPPAAAPEPAPAGLRVAVVLVVEDGGTDTVGVDDLRTALEQLREDRSTEVADLRVVVPDDRAFTADVSALLAGDGHDLVCLLGDAPGTVVVDLAERFPATRFCAIGTERDGLPTNVQLIEVAHEELGYALGETAEALAGGGRVAVLTGEDRSDRARRRDGLTRALDEEGPVQVALSRDASGELDTEQLARQLEAAAEEGDLGAYVLDAPPDLAVAAARVLPDDAVIAPARDTVDLEAVVVRYRIEVAAIVGRAVDRLVDDRPADRGEVGFAEEAFMIEIDDRAAALQPVLTAARERLAAGVIDLEGPPPPGSTSPSGTDGDGSEDAAEPDDAGQEQPPEPEGPGQDPLGQSAPPVMVGDAVSATP